MHRNRMTQNGPDWRDVTSAALHYAEMWGKTVAIVLRPGGTGPHPVLTVVAQAYNFRSEVGVVQPWASASVAMPASGVGDLSAAALSALYELDKEVYRRETGISSKTP